MKTTIQFVFLFLFLVCESIAQTAWTPGAMIQYKRVGSPVLSPDGKWVAYTISTPMMEGDKSEFVSQVWVSSTDGKSNVQYTFSEKGCADPKFSPDGNYISFISSRGGDGKSQLWIMRLNGGEAEAMTMVQGGIGQYAWSPDGKRIAFLMVDIDESEGKRIKEKKDWTIVDTWKYAHLYTVALEKNKQGGRSIQRLTGGNFHVTGFDWSKDNSSLVFSHQASPSADVWPTTDISIVPSDSGAVRPLVTGKGLDDSPLFSPDGRWIAYVSDGGDSRWALAIDIYIMPSTGGQPKKLGETPDSQANIIDWSFDGKEIYFSETDRTTNRAFALPVNGGKPRVITTGNGSYSGFSFSRDGKAMAFIHQSPEVSPEIFVSPMATFSPKKLSDANKDLPKLAMGRTEVVKWKSKDGMEIEGLLTYPVHYKPGRKYPLVLNIHGGPAGVFMQTFTAAGSIYPIQAFAQQGYAVLRPNPRGSSGYGKGFRRANINDWGFGDFDDDQTGVDKVIEMGIAHPDSLVICGWSYGGYMTAFSVTKTNRFKAASVGAGVTNLMSIVGTGDIPSFGPDYFGGEYWDRMETYMKHSAMFNIKNVKTPTQVIHGERDVRVPPSQGFEFYTAMKRLGIPTEMIVYPRTPHGPQEPKFIQDIGERILSWFNYHLRKKGTP